MGQSPVGQRHACAIEVDWGCAPTSVSIVETPYGFYSERQGEEYVSTTLDYY